MRTRPLLLTLAAALSPLAACERGPASPSDVVPTLRFGIGTSNGFSDWITEPTVFNDPPETTLLCPDDDVLPCVETTTQRSGITGGTYGYDPDRDGVPDAILTAEVELLSAVTAPGDGTFAYAWTVSNLGSGAVTGVPCGPNGPSFAISDTDPLLGTAGADRLIDTGDDLGSGETHTQGTISDIPGRTILCHILLNPSVGRVVEILVPLPASPTSKEQCKDDGWQDFGFANQWECVSFVETGKDSR